MSTGTQVDARELAEAVYSFAAMQMKSGASTPEIEAALIQKGLDQEAARTVTTNLARLRDRAMNEVGRRNMRNGARWFVGGCLVTFVTYAMAASSGGGGYIVTWGAIVFGAIQFIRGWTQVN